MCVCVCVGGGSSTFQVSSEKIGISIGTCLFVKGLQADCSDPDGRV